MAIFEAMFCENSEGNLQQNGYRTVLAKIIQMAKQLFWLKLGFDPQDGAVNC